MGWQHRDYAREDEYARVPRRSTYHGSGMGAISIVSAIIIVNIIVHFLMHSRSQLGRTIFEIGVMQANAVLHGQVWRLFTATYLHASLGHIFFNMLALYFFGPALERAWGRRQFFVAYTLGGVVGNVLLTLAGLVGFIDPQTYGVGASGSVLTLLGAAAVLFPNAQVYIYFLFPIRIRTFVLLYGIYFVYNVMQRGSNYGGDICHLGGLAVGLWWAWSGGFSLSGRHRTVVNPNSLLGRLAARLGRGSMHPRSGGGTWDRHMQRRREDLETIDRILAKVSEHGVQSLTPEEKRALQEATERRRAEERRWERMDREP
jgi:membrane associated rhomboid family serine protease